MIFDYPETQEFEVEWDGEIELDEIDQADASDEIAQLTAAVRGARAWH